MVPPQVWGIPPGAFVPPIGLTPSSRAAAEYHENLQNAFVGEVAASAGRELAGLAEGAIAVARKTPSGVANDLGLRVAGGQSVGSAIAEIVTENVDPTGSGRRAHAEGKGVLAIAGSVVGGNVENAIEVAKDVLPINQSLRAMDSSLPMADRVEAGLKALSQTSALMAGLVKTQGAGSGLTTLGRVRRTGAPSTGARVWTQGKGFRGHQVLDRVNQEIEFATRRATKVLDAGKGGGYWGRQYRDWLAVGDSRAPMARGHAIQHIVNKQLANNRYLQEAGTILDHGSILGIRNERLLRPDFQMRLPNQAVGIIDITTPRMGPKIGKYQDPAGVTKSLLNVLYEY